MNKKHIMKLQNNGNLKHVYVQELKRASWIDIPGEVVLADCQKPKQVDKLGKTHSVALFVFPVAAGINWETSGLARPLV